MCVCLIYIFMYIYTIYISVDIDTDWNLYIQMDIDLITCVWHFSLFYEMCLEELDYVSRSIFPFNE